MKYFRLLALAIFAQVLAFDSVFAVDEQTQVNSTANTTIPAAMAAPVPVPVAPVAPVVPALGPINPQTVEPTVIPSFVEPGLTAPITHTQENSHSSTIRFDKAPIDPTDYASLQRGARLFMDVCSGCHSLKYVRYDSLARGLEITDEDGKILEKIVKDNLMFTGDTLASPIESAMSAKDGEAWFGIAPPDLTLEARYRGVDWLYGYLRSFYYDPTRPWGVNNLVYPDVAMPHVLINMQGTQILTETGLKLAKKGTMTEAEYNSAMADLVNFLSFVAEPVQVERRKIGAWVLVFLGIFLVFSYLLKREYWKDVHK